MNKKTLMVAGIVVVVVVLGGWLVMAKHNKDSGSDMGNMNTSQTNSSSSSQAPKATNAVNIQNFAFSPSAITVKQGTTVTWTNKDGTAHTVTETDSQTGPNSGNVNPGASYSFTFATPGTYHYHCAIHPEMLGTVTVTSS